MASAMVLIVFAVNIAPQVPLPGMMHCSSRASSPPVIRPAPCAAWPSR